MVTSHQLSWEITLLYGYHGHGDIGDDRRNSLCRGWRDAHGRPPGISQVAGAQATMPESSDMGRAKSSNIRRRALPAAIALAIAAESLPYIGAQQSAMAMSHRPAIGPEPQSEARNPEPASVPAHDHPENQDVDGGRVIAAQVGVGGDFPVLAAVSQPTLARGRADQLGGNLTFSETASNQFRQLCDLLAHQTTTFAEIILELKATDGVGKRGRVSFDTKEPVVSANTATGCVGAFAGFESDHVMRVAVWPPARPRRGSGRSVGVVTISNVCYVVPADAVPGPIRIVAKLRGTRTIGADLPSGQRIVVTLPLTADPDAAMQVVSNAWVP